MKPNKGLSVKESLAKLGAQDLEEPGESQLQRPDDLTSVVINLQNRIAGLTTVQEGLIDLLKVFDIIDMGVLNIAIQNVLEYDKVPQESQKVFVLRLRALKKKLADYSKSQSQPPELPKDKRKHG